MVTIAFHKDLTLQKWASKPLSWQILSVASEIGRAESSLDHGGVETFRTCLERGLELIDLTVEANQGDPSFLREVLRFREILASFYVDPNPKRATEFKELAGLWLTLEPEAYNLLAAGR